MVRRAPARTGDSSGTDSPTSPATLRHLVDTLGSVVIEVEAPGRHLDAPINHLVISDPADTATFEPGDVILAVGIPADEPRATEMVRRAGADGAAAVLLRSPVPEGLAAVGDAAGIGVVAVAPEVTWGHLYTLLRTAAGTAGRALGVGEEVAPAGDLFTLANAVAATVGGPVTIEDPQSRVLAFSNLGHPVDEARRQTILGRRVPPEWIDRLRAEGFFAQLWSTHDVVEYGGGGHNRLAIAVRAGDEILGQIWAADAGEGFEPSAHDAIREAAEIAALHLVRHRMGEDLERRMRGEVLRALLEGRGSVDVNAQRFGARPDSPATVIAFEVRGDDDAAVALARERVRELVVTYGESFRRRLANVVMDRVLYVMLLGGPEEGSDKVAVRLAADVVGRSEQALGADVRAAVGTTVSHLRHVPEARSEVDRVLKVFARYGFARRWARAEDVRAYTALLELESMVSTQPNLRLHQLDTLAQHDEEHGSQYVATLRAYLDAFGDVSQAAKAIHVHPNTFRYRLRRLLEVSGLDLENPDERIVIELQLRAR